MDNQLKNSILRTICHFDVLSRPLTLLELTENLGVPANVNQVHQALNREPLNKIINCHNGLYFLAGRESILSVRHEHYRLVLKKLDLAKRYCQALKCFPWVRGIAIYGSLALKNSRDQGDIDLFFVTDANRAWSARFFINSALKLLRLRPTPQNTKNRICPSYFADLNHLDLSVANHESDYYYYYNGPASFNFISAEPGVADKFFIDNLWVNTNLPNWKQPTPILQVKQVTTELKILMEKLFGLITESTYHKIQLKILPQQYYQASDGKRVILESGLIKLHHNDRRIANNKLFDDNFAKYSQT